MAESVSGTPDDAKTRKRALTPRSPPAPDRDTASDSRNLLLFSDGTGNSSAKSQKTNVWRFYEALDLGYPVRSKQCVQLAYYDNGVGTSSFRIFAILGGVFGFGLARNIRDIYKFLCRNHRDANVNKDNLDDRIYAFGFSRGAYTIRLLVAMVAATGLAPYSTERQLDRDARDLWREFRRDFHTNNPGTDFFVAIGRALLRFYYRTTRGEVWVHGLRSLLARLKIAAPRWLGQGQRYAAAVPAERRRFWWGREWWNHWKPWFLSWGLGAEGPPRSGSAAALPDCGPEIAFLGVWDTVAAYGGPIVEITRAIDEWIWPLTMPDYRLSPKVRVARHALAIDDKRDSFQPLLWDEVVEAELEREELIPEQKSDNPRLQQVWFAGMHSDVGGGYDDDSLAYVSLWWMIEHAEKADPHNDPHTRLRLLPDLRERIDLYRNVYGPIHDSRGGAAAFYRYQPRYINAWVDNPGRMQPATQIYRDPTIAAGAYRDRGLLKAPIRLHLSVEERLRMATDGYAPNNLPGDYTVDEGVEGTHTPNIPPASRAYLNALGNRIKLRRFWYFVTIALLFLLAIKPWWKDIPVLRVMTGEVDDRTNARLVESAISSFVPDVLATWTQAIAADVFRSILLVLLILWTTWLGVNHERSMVDLSRAMWRARFGGTRPPPIELRGLRKVTHAIARWFHRTDWLQAALAQWKWRTVPVVLGGFMWLGVVYIALAAVTQVWLARVEARPSTCLSAAPGGPSAAAEGGMAVALDAVCSDLNATVREGKVYRVVVRPPAGQRTMGWMDGGQPASVEGWTRHDREGFWGSLATSSASAGSRYFRRVIPAPLMTPVLEIRSRAEPGWRKRFMGDSIQVIVPQLQRFETADGPVWLGVFKAPEDQPFLYQDRVPEGGRGGRLYAFVNDAVLPFDRQVPWSDDCAALTVGIEFLNLCDRYRNNRGAWRIEVREQPATLLDTLVDEWFAVERGK